jgi:hypothetical protein
MTINDELGPPLLRAVPDLGTDTSPNVVLSPKARNFVWLSCGD